MESILASQFGLNLSNKLFSELYIIGNTKLLYNQKISIVGSRRPTQYTKYQTHKLAQFLNQAGITIVSGAAMGVDAIAHQACEDLNTIGVAASSLDIRTPRINKALIQAIEEKGLMISPFKPTYEARPYSFVQRNELVVDLGELLIVTQADLNSGSMRSVEFALKKDKPIYVLPHRRDESLGTNHLIQNNLATPLYDFEILLKHFNVTNNKIDHEGKNQEDELLLFCKTKPSYEEAVAKFGDRIFEYELKGKITIKNGFISLV